MKNITKSGNCAPEKMVYFKNFASKLRYSEPGESQNSRNLFVTITWIPHEYGYSSYNVSLRKVARMVGNYNLGIK